MGTQRMSKQSHLLPVMSVLDCDIAIKHIKRNRRIIQNYLTRINVPQDEMDSCCSVQFWRANKRKLAYHAVTTHLCDGTEVAHISQVAGDYIDNVQFLNKKVVVR